MRADLARRLGDLDLRTTDASILVLVGANPGITQSYLCKMLEIQRANMTPLIARLDVRGLIVRAVADGRSQGLALTDAGSDLAATALSAMYAHEEYLLSLIPDEQRPHIMPLLSSIWRE